MAQAGSAILDNLYFLRQAQDLVGSLSQDQFVETNSPMYGSGIGPHLRHCLDHYQLFIQGWKGGEIDYDQRLREEELEGNREVMLARFPELIAGLEGLDPEKLHQPLRIKMDCGSESLEPFSASSVLRELQFLISHTVHHFALVAMILHDQGLTVPSGFGVAPSTLKYRAGQSQCAR